MTHSSRLREKRYRDCEVVGLFERDRVSPLFVLSDARRSGSLTNFGNERFEFGVAGERNDQALDGSDGGREGENSSVDIVGTSPVRVFEEGVEDTTDTERRLDNVGNEFTNWKRGLAFRGLGLERE